MSAFLVDLALLLAAVSGALALVALGRMYFPLVERWIAAHEAPPAPRKPPPVIPPDLILAAERWGDPWARDQALAAMVELYEQVGSWDAVRTVHANMEPPSS